VPGGGVEAPRPRPLSPLDSPGDAIRQHLDDWLKTASEFRDTADSRKLGDEGAAVEWLHKLDLGNLGKVALPLLEWSASTLVYEQLGVLPEIKNLTALQAWLDRMKYLNILVARFGLTIRVARNLAARSDVRGWLKDFCERWHLDRAKSGGPEPDLLLISAFLSGFADFRRIRMFDIGWFPYASHMQAVAAGIDHAELLRRVALPAKYDEWFRKSLNLRNPRPNLHHLLMLVLASPQCLEKIEDPYLAIALVLLAATHLASAGLVEFPAEAPAEAGAAVAQPLHSAVVADRFLAGIRWLAESLPRRALLGVLEQDITSAVQLAYSAERVAPAMA
jgi:hypothetical protein